jgi:hypothetical protein
MGHINGVSRSAGTLQIEDENGNTIFEKSFDDIGGGGTDNDPDWCCDDEIWAGSKPKGTVVFIGSSNEKGTFFEGEIELRAPFDITKLELHYDEFDGEDIISSVVYDGEDIDNFGGSTDGKSSDMNMVLITDDQGNWERYSPEEKDWGHPPCGPGPSDWEKSPKFKFAKVKPTVEGWYGAVWRSFGTTYGTLYWNGTEFGEWEYGQFKPQAGVDTWQGYNWDTSSWVNQPPEPADVTMQIIKNVVGLVCEAICVKMMTITIIVQNVMAQNLNGSTMIQIPKKVVLIVKSIAKSGIQLCQWTELSKHFL